jgi:aryl-alcohol dehydrogenase-like predicted oxidoreductase
MQTTLQTRRLGTTDLHITAIGFGAWAIGGGDWKFGWGAQDDAQSIAAIRRALEHGVNWIDTAAVYGFGHSEEIVAKALDGIAERPYVFTKCGLVPSGKNDGSPIENISRDSIVAECEASLRRLRVETIDLYQIHWPTDEIAEIDEAWAAMEALRASGKVRAIGVSNFNVDEMRRAERIAPIGSLQPPYSLVKRRIERDILPHCKEQNIGVIVYSPMQSGLLSGTMTRERIAALPANDWRSKSDEFAEPKLTRNLELVERLRAVGARHGKSPGEVAIAWTLRDPVVTGAIVGGRSPEQVDGIMGAAAFRLDPTEIAEIEA